MIPFAIGLIAGILLCEIVCHWNAGFSLIREAYESIRSIVRH